MDLASVEGGNSFVKVAVEGEDFGVVLLLEADEVEGAGGKVGRDEGQRAEEFEH